MNVLIATDGSEPALDAAHRSLTLLRDGARISLVMVIPDKEDPMATAGGFEGPVITEEGAEAAFAAANLRGQAALEATRAAVDGDVDVRLIPVDGATGAAIVEIAAEMSAEVIVIGASGKGFFRRLLSGSVSDYVVHHAHCPVLVVRHDHLT